MAQQGGWQTMAIAIAPGPNLDYCHLFLYEVWTKTALHFFNDQRKISEVQIPQSINKVLLAHDYARSYRWLLLHNKGRME